ncbi:MAG: HlyD family efflux transporter periplasmic adaptor subunit [Caldilineales bacterium]|nr:HlyD family efflux transporter periplasmic adaptor subunit [Caldilineales bacterium]
MKKRIVIIALVIVTLAAGGFAFRQFRSNAAQVAEASEPETIIQTPGDRIVVDARVVPMQRADLSLPVSGNVAEILVSEGDTVEEGQPLLRLVADRQHASVAQAEAQLTRAEAQLAELEAGARAEEIASADAALAAAQARMARVANGPLSEEVAAAQATLAEAQASLQKTLEGVSQQQLIAAETELANAQAVVRQAQAAYDRVRGNPHIGALPEAAQLEQATNNVVAAQARLDDLKRGANTADIASARARVNRAQAQLDALQATNPADLEAAQAEVRQAEAQLALTKAGARSEAVEIARADVAAAQATLDQALAALAETELRAPFAGTIAWLDARVGEQVAAGAPIVRLADLSAWEIETEDLTEFDAINIEEGMPATITFDAIPGLQKTATVRILRPIGEDLRGDIVYTVVLMPDQQDSRLLWNLTAVVTFDIG